MAFLIFILFVCLFVLYLNFSSLKNENKSIKSQLEKNTEESKSLKREFVEFKKSLENKTISNEPLITPEIVQEVKEKQTEDDSIVVNEAVTKEYKPYFTPIPDAELPQEKEAIVPEKEVIVTPKSEEKIHSFEGQTTPKIEKQIPIKEKVYVESAFSKFMKKAEKQFADNWTGILGTAIMVLGIGYLSIYTALKVSPLFRVLILWLYAGLLVGSYYILKKKKIGSRLVCGYEVLERVCFCLDALVLLKFQH